MTQDENVGNPTEKKQAEERKLPAKTLSKAMKILAVVGIILCHALKWMGVLNADSGEICQMWAVVYALGAGTIDMNIMLDKFRRQEEMDG